MSDVEKLRALLAEAREICEYPEFVPSSENRKHARSLRARIDAALAEPVVECSRCETLRQLADTAAAEQGLAQRRMMEAQKQRNEARAQIEQMNLEAADVRRLARSMAEDAFRKRDEARKYAEERNDEANRLQRYLNMAAQERDEARAEVERLQQAVHTRACRNQSAYNLNCVCGADEHQRDLQKLAYRRGAEAMREAAALCVLDSARFWSAQYVADDIRALPIPEDEP